MSTIVPAHPNEYAIVIHHWFSGRFSGPSIVHVNIVAWHIDRDRKAHPILARAIRQTEELVGIVHLDGHAEGQGAMHRWFGTCAAAIEAEALEIFKWSDKRLAGAEAEATKAIATARRTATPPAKSEGDDWF